MVKVAILKKPIFKQIKPGGRGALSLQIGITTFFLFLVSRSLSSADIGLLLQSIDPFAILTALLLGGAAILLQAFRWYAISRTFLLNLTYGAAIMRLLWGNLLAFITPGSVGELFRSVDLCPSKKMITIMSTLTDRIFGNVTVVIAALPILIFQQLFMHRSIPIFFSVSTVVTTALIFLFFVLMRLRIRWYDKLPKQIAKTVSDFVATLHSIDMSVMMLLSLLHHLLLIIQAAILLKCFVNVSFVEGFMVSVFSYTCMLFIPISVANIGVREYSFSLFLSFAARDGDCAVSIPAAAFGVSSVLLIINIIIPATAGLVGRVIQLPGSGGMNADSFNNVMILQSNKLSKEKGFN